MWLVLLMLMFYFLFKSVPPQTLPSSSSASGTTPIELLQLVVVVGLSKNKQTT
jgi:hypothetical protein